MNEVYYCNTCGDKVNPKTALKLEVYDHPFDNASRTAYFHKRIPKEYKDSGYNRYHESCLDGFFEQGDFNYFVCQICGRTVCEQNPSNGWHVQYRIVNGEQICLKCFEKEILENGIPREDFEDGKLNGMFFSRNNAEAVEAGYEIVEPFDNYRVGDEKPVIKKALELIDSGHKVIVGYESMAIGGLEGYITLFSKEA